jgi:hypothetical protein
MIQSGFLDLGVLPGNKHPLQNRWYNRCSKPDMAGSHSWIAFIDLDEFMVVLDKCVSFVGAVLFRSLFRSCLFLRIMCNHSYTLMQQSRPLQPSEVSVPLLGSDHLVHLMIASFFDSNGILCRGVAAKSPDLKSVLRSFKGNAGLSLQWVIFGSSGHTKRPTPGGPLAHYHQCTGKLSFQMKCMANMYHATHHMMVGNTVHDCTYKCASGYLRSVFVTCVACDTASGCCRQQLKPLLVAYTDASVLCAEWRTTTICRSLWSL